jgi:hypothetical protein
MIELAETIPNKLEMSNILEQVKHTDYVLMPDGRTTICQITMANGFTVRGESSCVDINNFNKSIGEKVAWENALDKIWLLEGYRLQQRRFEAGL